MSLSRNRGADFFTNYVSLLRVDSQIGTLVDKKHTVTGQMHKQELQSRNARKEKNRTT